MNISETHFPSSSDNVVDRVAETTHGMVNQAAAKAGPAVEHLRETAQAAVDNLAEKATRIQTIERRLVGSATDNIRSHPFVTVGIAVGLGWLIGRLRH